MFKKLALILALALSCAGGALAQFSPFNEPGIPGCGIMVPGALTSNCAPMVPQPQTASNPVITCQGTGLNFTLSCNSQYISSL